MAGCDLLASLDAVQLFMMPTTAATYSFSVPFATALVGVSVFHQFVQFGLDAQGGLSSLSSSNGLSIVVGSF
jgi:hypothetical protein